VRSPLSSAPIYPHNGLNRKLSLDNRHLGRIVAYQVNCQAPEDPDIRKSARRIATIDSRIMSWNTCRQALSEQGREIGLGSAQWRFLLFARFAFLWRREKSTGMPGNVVIDDNGRY